MDSIYPILNHIESRRDFWDKLFRLADLETVDPSDHRGLWKPAQYPYFLVLMEHRMLQSMYETLEFCSDSPKNTFGRKLRHRFTIWKIRCGFLPVFFSNLPCPPPQTSAKAAMAQWKNVRYSTLDLFIGLPDYAHQSTIFIHPKLGKITLQQWVEILRAYVHNFENKLIKITDRKEKRMRKITVGKPVLFYAYPKAIHLSHTSPPKQAKQATIPSKICAKGNL